MSVILIKIFIGFLCLDLAEHGNFENPFQIIVVLEKLNFQYSIFVAVTFVKDIDETIFM